MVTTQDYINAIEQAKTNKNSLSINFGKLPKEIDKNSVFNSLSNGMNDEYKSAIKNVLDKDTDIDLDFAILPITSTKIEPSFQMGIPKTGVGEPKLDWAEPGKTIKEPVSFNDKIQAIHSKVGGVIEKGWETGIIPAAMVGTAALSSVPVALAVAAGLFAPKVLKDTGIGEKIGLSEIDYEFLPIAVTEILSKSPILGEAFRRFISTPKYAGYTPEAVKSFVVEKVLSGEIRPSEAPKVEEALNKVLPYGVVIKNEIKAPFKGKVKVGKIEAQLQETASIIPVEKPVEPIKITGKEPVKPITPETKPTQPLIEGTKEQKISKAIENIDKEMQDFKQQRKEKGLPVSNEVSGKAYKNKMKKISDAIISQQEPQIESPIIQKTIEADIVKNVNDLHKMVIPKNSRLPILENSMSKGGKLISTDLEMAIISKTNLPEGMYKQVGKDTVKINESIDDFPSVPTEVKGNTVKISISPNMIKRSLSHVSDDEARYDLTGTNIRNLDGNLYMVGTDGRRMTFNNLGKTNLPKDFNVILPQKPLKILSKYKTSQQIDITFAGDKFKISTPQYDIVSKYIEGKYPNWEQVLSRVNQEMIMDKEQLKNAIAEVSPYFPKENITSKTTFQMKGKDKITLTVYNQELGNKIVEIPVKYKDISTTRMKPEMSGTVVMPVRMEGRIQNVQSPKTDFAINADYVNDVIKNIKSDNVYLYKSNEPINAILFHGKSIETKPTEKIVEFHAGLPIPQAIIDTSNNYINGVIHEIDKLKYLSGLKQYPALQNDIRLFQGKIRHEKTGIQNEFVELFNKLTDIESRDVLDIAFTRDELGRLKAGKIGERSIEEAQAHLDDLNANASADTQNSVNRYFKISERIREDLIARGKLQPEQHIEDYIRHYVNDYFEDWQMYITFPNKAKTPYRPYSKHATGTKKSYKKDFDAMLHSILRPHIDNVIDDFWFDKFNEYNAYDKMEKSRKLEIFGFTERMTPGGNITRIANQPVAGKIYNNIDITGNPHIGFQYEKGRYLYSPAVDGEPSNILALGRQKKVYVIPLDMAKELERLNPRYWVGWYVFNRFTSYWKSTAIGSTFLKYNINNLVGDSFMVYMQYPSALLETGNSIKFLATDPKKYTSEQAILSQKLIEQDIVGANFINTELPHILKYQRNPISHILKKSQDASQFRESINRVSVFVRLMKEYQTNPDIISKFDWIDTYGLTPENAIGKISRQLCIDYNATSKAFNVLIKGAFFPFGTWPIKTSILLGNYTAKHPFGFMFKFGLPLALLTLWNNTERKEEEVELPNWVRNRLHFVVGKNKTGEIVTIIPNFPTDVLLGFPIFNIMANNTAKVMTGELTYKEAATRIIEDGIDVTKKSVGYLFHPVFRAVIDLNRNEDSFTNKEIVPKDRKVTYLKQLEHQTAYLLKTLLPPIALYMRSTETKNNLSDKPILNIPKEFFLSSKNLGIYNVMPTGTLEELNRKLFAKDIIKNTILYDITQEIIKAKGNIDDEVINSYLKKAEEQQVIIKEDDIKRVVQDMDTEIGILYQRLKFTSGYAETKEINDTIMILRKVKSLNKIKGNYYVTPELEKSIEAVTKTM